MGFLKGVNVKICVSSSGRFKSDWTEIAKRLKKLEIELVFPDFDETAGLAEVNRKFCADIDSSDILYVWCPKGYIGKGVAAEIGYAIAREKDIISSSKIDDVGICSLAHKVMNINQLVKYLRSEYGI